MADNIAENAINGIGKAQEAFKNMIKDKNKWLMLYLILIIIFIVWLLFWYIRSKIMLKEVNNKNMEYNLTTISGSGISGINSGNPNHSHKLRDYYMATSYNSCCGGSTQKDFVDKKSLNPVFMYGTSGIDPNVQTENIGDNPIKASNYGLNNLKIVASKLDEWTTKEGNSYNDLNELYNEMLSVYKRYIFHVVKIIGGVNETLLFKGQNGIPFMNVDYNKQISALIFLDNNLWSTQRWLMEPDLISKIKQDGILERIQNIQYSALNNLLEYSKLNRMVSTSSTLKGKALDPSELIYQLYLSLYDINKKLDNSLMVLQIRFLDNLNILIEETKLNPSLKSGLLNIQNLIYKNVKKSTRASKSKNNDHYEYLKRMIENNKHK